MKDQHGNRLGDPNVPSSIEEALEWCRQLLTARDERTNYWAYSSLEIWLGRGWLRGPAFEATATLAAGLAGCSRISRGDVLSLLVNIGFAEAKDVDCEGEDGAAYLRRCRQELLQCVPVCWEVMAERPSRDTEEALSLLGICAQVDPSGAERFDRLLTSLLNDPETPAALRLTATHWREGSNDLDAVS